MSFQVNEFVKPVMNEDEIQKAEVIENGIPTPSGDSNDVDDKKEKEKPARFSLEWFGFVVPEEKHKAPHLGLIPLFLKFFSFGCRAFGGPGTTAWCC